MIDSSEVLTRRIFLRQQKREGNTKGVAKEVSRFSSCTATFTENDPEDLLSSCFELLATLNFSIFVLETEQEIRKIDQFNQNVF